jgi:hypothetical protein
MNGNTAGPSSGGPSGSLSPTMDSGSLRRTGTPNNNNNDITSNTTKTSNSSNNGSGHKIAFDPQDLETRSEEAELPKLTLMEEIILLGIKEWVYYHMLSICCYRLTLVSAVFFSKSVSLLSTRLALLKLASPPGCATLRSADQHSA